MSNGWAPPSLTLQALIESAVQSEARSVSNGWAPPSLTLRASDWTALSIRSPEREQRVGSPVAHAPGSDVFPVVTAEGSFYDVFPARIIEDLQHQRNREDQIMYCLQKNFSWTPRITIYHRWTASAELPYPFCARIRATPSPVSARLFGAGRGSTGPTWRCSGCRCSYWPWQRVFDVGFRVVCGVEEPRKNLPQRSCILSRAGAWVPGLDRRGGPGNLSKE